jgi:hypothetical protein
LLYQLDVWFDFSALIARVPVFVDVERLCETPRCLEASRNPEFAQSARKLLAGDRRLDRHARTLDSFRRTPKSSQCAYQLFCPTDILMAASIIIIQSKIVVSIGLLCKALAETWTQLWVRFMFHMKSGRASMRNDRALQQALRESMET